MHANAAIANTLTQFNLEQIALLRGLRNGQLLPQLLRLYRDQTPEQLRHIETAVQEQDAQRLVTLTHTLKSASLSIGAQLMGECCATFEQAAKQGDLTHSAALSARLNEHFAALLVEMEPYLS